VFLVKALGGDWQGAKAMTDAQPRPEAAAAR
jgi:hypothetical protein